MRMCPHYYSYSNRRLKSLQDDFSLWIAIFMLLPGKGIKKEFGIQTVLDIDKIEIMEGARIGLVGRNGIGKTTLLSVLAGNMKAERYLKMRFS